MSATVITQLGGGGSPEPGFSLPPPWALQMDDCGDPCAGGGAASRFSESPVLCSADAHLDKLQREQRPEDTLNVPFLSLLPADHASCFSKSFPDIGDLLLSNLVTALSLSSVSQRGCPGARVCPPGPRPQPPQVIPRGPEWAAPPMWRCLRDVHWGRESQPCPVLPAETILGMPLHAMHACFLDCIVLCSGIHKSHSSARGSTRGISRWLPEGRKFLREFSLGQASCILRAASRVHGHLQHGPSKECAFMGAQKKSLWSSALNLEEATVK